MDYYNYNEYFSNITDQQATDIIAGAAVGSVMTTYLICAIVMTVLLIIAWWKIFTKAGEKGWKSLIPIYNLVVFFKIIGINPWWILLGLTAIIPFVGIIALIVLEVWSSIRTAKVFGKGTGTILGLIFFPNIFTLVLAFGSAEYQGADAGKE